MKWSVITRTFFTSGGLVQIHRRLYTGVVQVHQLQWGICPDYTQRSLWHFSLECSTMRASPHYRAAILCHHGPPKFLLSESQGPLLALMTGTPFNAIWHCPTGMTKARTPSVSPLGVVLMYTRPLFKMRLLQIRKNTLPCSVSASAPRHSLRRVSRHGSSMSFLRWSHLQHVAKAASASWASSQSTMCIGPSFIACTLASWLKHSQELLTCFGLAPVSHPYSCPL